jgi:hypothetical protein
MALSFPSCEIVAEPQPSKVIEPEEEILPE